MCDTSTAERTGKAPLEVQSRLTPQLPPDAREQHKLPSKGAALEPKGLSLSLLDMGTGQSPRASKPTQCLLIGFRGVRNECRTSIGLQPSSLRCRFQDVRTLSSTYVFLPPVFHGTVKTNQTYKVKGTTQSRGALPLAFTTLPLTFTSQLHQECWQAVPVRPGKASC